MSFFGFDTSGNQAKDRDGRDIQKPLDFEDTYKGLGDYDNEEEDF